jgi:hypothetical protein
MTCPALSDQRSKLSATGDRRGTMRRSRGEVIAAHATGIVDPVADDAWWR